jgi:hypothetical protein
VDRRGKQGDLPLQMLVITFVSCKRQEAENENVRQADDARKLNELNVTGNRNGRPSWQGRGCAHVPLARRGADCGGQAPLLSCSCTCCCSLALPGWLVGSINRRHTKAKAKQAASNTATQRGDEGVRGCARRLEGPADSWAAVPLPLPLPLPARPPQPVWQS